jgi:hypothetical protein
VLSERRKSDEEGKYCMKHASQHHFAAEIRRSRLFRKYLTARVRVAHITRVGHGENGSS